MGRIDQMGDDWQAALAALAWQVDLGIDTVVQETPVNRYEVVAAAPIATPERAQAPDAAAAVDVVAEAVRLASRATTLDALRDAIAAFEPCEIKLGARNMVFAGGTIGARIMVVGEAPDRDEDRAGAPFAGAKGALFDRMFAAIGLSRDAQDTQDALYLTCALPWKTPGDRAPEVAEIDMMRPFLMQHIALATPDIVVAMGNDAQLALMPGTPLDRGGWATVLGRPLLAMQHPAALLRNPAAKREAWADLLALKARMEKGTP